MLFLRFFIRQFYKVNETFDIHQNSKELMQFEKLHTTMKTSHRKLHDSENAERKRFARKHEHKLMMNQRRL